MAASSPYALGILNLFFLLVGIVVLTVVNVYVLVKWQHPEDKNQWVSAKAAVVLGMLVTELVIVGLPLDVANNGGARDCSYDWGDTAECGGLDMRAYWLSVFGLAIAWVWVVIPTYVFAYEAHDELGEHTTGDTFKAAACSEFGLLVVFLIIVIPMYFIINEVKLPVRDSVAKTSLRISRDVARRAARAGELLRQLGGGSAATARAIVSAARALVSKCQNITSNLARREVVRRAARQKECSSNSSPRRSTRSRARRSARPSGRSTRRRASTASSSWATWRRRTGSSARGPRTRSSSA